MSIWGTALSIKVFLAVSFILGILDDISTRIGLSRGLTEGSPLHNLLNPTSITSSLIGILGLPILMILMSLKFKGKLIPHTIVIIQLINVAINITLVLALIKGKLLLS